jgi:predicted dehydrogenase
MFLGPAPQRRYNPNRGLYHFRWFWDYSGGQMTNLGHHVLDIVHWVLEVEPHAVASVGGRFALTDNGETPDTQDALFAFRTAAAPHPEVDRGALREPVTTGCTAVWSHRETSGGYRASTTKTFELEFCGTKGSLAISRQGFVVTADKKVPPHSRIPTFAGAHPVGGPQPVAVVGPVESWTTALEDNSGNTRDQFKRHARNFLDCVKTRETPISDLESSHRVSTMCHLANLSMRLGRSLRWDAGREEVVGDATANEALAREYRAPWDRDLRALLPTS